MAYIHLTALVLSTLAASSAAAPVSTAAPVSAATPGTTLEEVGSVQLLFQNDLTINTTSTSALLLEEPGSYAKSATKCAALSEQLLPKVAPDIQDQLNYLIYSGQLDDDACLYIDVQGSDHNKQDCVAYSVANASVVRVDCETELRALCTQSAPLTKKTLFGQRFGGNQLLTIQTDGYNITGYRDARSFRFLGIPFAQPPLESLRFEPPQPYPGTAVINALRAGQACIQAPSPYGVTSLHETGEDCLTLNIFTPFLPNGESPNTAGRAVLVWFYGGSFIEGWSDLPDYDGGNLVSRGDVVVVTVNYRVGALGFLTTNSTIHGNQGLQDQILALQWVQDHISAFGGDPSRVMIFGQSAGAQSVVAHLSSSASKGLFSSAVPQSSLLGVSFVTRDVNTRFITPALANATNCTAPTEDSLIACLRALPADSFVDSSINNLVVNAGISAFQQFDALAAGLAASEPYLPITAASGGPPGIIDDQFQYLLGNGSLPNRVPVMIGTMRDEAGLFIPETPAFANPVPNNVGTYTAALTSGLVVSKRTADAIIASGQFALNLSDPDGVRDRLVDVITSFAWQCPWQQAFEIATEKSIFPSLYTYVFDKGVPQAPASPGRCFPQSTPYQQICHTTDISAVWGFSDVEDDPYNSTNSLPFTQYVMDTWISFARTHDPQPNSDYLRVRGTAYQFSLQTSTEVSFPAYANTSTGVIHHFDLPPYNSGPLHTDRCQVYETSGGYTTLLTMRCREDITSRIIGFGGFVVRGLTDVY